MRILKQNDTSRKLVFLLVSSSDHITPVAGATPTVMVSKNGSQFTSPSGTVSEVGHGWYALTPSSDDTDTLGPLIVHAEAEGADPVDIEYQVVRYDPYDGESLGLARLDAAVSTRVAATDERLDRLDVAVSTRLASADYVPPDNTTISRIATQTDRLRFDEQDRVLAATTAEVDPNSISSAVWDAPRSEHTATGTFGAVAEWAGAAGVIVQPLAARVFTAVGDGGVITLWRHARVRASWHVDADLTGHDIRWIIYRALEPSIVVREIRGDAITIEPQTVGSLIAVDGPDDLAPAPGEYRYVLRDQTVDAVLLAGRCVVMDAPDAS